MSSVIVNYAAVRFLPYRETDEFVNVGVIIYCPEKNRFAFKCVKGKSTRVRRFFPELDKEVLPKGLEALTKGLSRLRKNFDLGESDSPPTEAEIKRGMEIFRELSQPRESILHFSPAGSLVAESWEKGLDELYDRYVDRRIASSPKEQEHRIQLRLDGLFKEWNFRNAYRVNKKIGRREAHATWNFVSFDESGERSAEHALKAFKVLSLDRDDASDVSFIGNAWINHIAFLRAHGVLPGQAVFTLKMPTDESKMKAAEEVKKGLESSNVIAVSADDTERIKMLAQVAPRQSA